MTQQVLATAGHHRATGLATTPEVASYLRMTPGALLTLRHEGKAPRAAKVGTRLLWRWEDVESWLDERSTAQPQREHAA